MDSLVFSLNATTPIFLLVLLGMFFRRIGWLDKDLAARINSFVFKAALPVLVFNDLASTDIRQNWDSRFVCFCAAVTLLSILLCWLVSYLWRDRSIRGEFIQASYRSSATIIGIALNESIYGNAGMSPLMLIGSVPIYNVAAVIILTIFGEQHQTGRQAVKQTAKEIITNPILIGILAGILWVLLDIPMPAILEKTLSSLGGIAAPLGLMAMGASLDWKAASSNLLPSLISCFLKLIGLCAIFLPIAIAIGYRQESLIAILIMLSSATTVSSYVMAKSMGYEGTLTASVVLFSTLFSAITVTGWLWILRSFSLV